MQILIKNHSVQNRTLKTRHLLAGQVCALPVRDPAQKPCHPSTLGWCTAMNNVTGTGGGHWACAQEKKRGSSSSSFTTLISFHSPPLPCSPNPLAAGCTAEGQKEKKRREAKTQKGRGKDRGGVLGCSWTCREESVWMSDDSHAKPKDQTDQER